MSDTPESRPTVLVVEDEEPLTDLYATWLADDYDVRTAYGGNEALEQYDDAVDVILLDRRMPDLSGDQVLAEIRDRGADCPVVMVTAVDPDFDVLSMGFDDYVTKPVTHDELLDVVDQMLARRSYDADVRTYFGLVAKRAALAPEKTETELASSDEYAALERRIADLEAEIDATLADFEDEDFEAAFRDLSED